MALNAGKVGPSNQGKTENGRGSKPIFNANKGMRKTGRVQMNPVRVSNTGFDYRKINDPRFV